MARFCLNCGNLLKENDKFCRKCGTPVRTIAPPPQAQSTVPQAQSAAPSYDMPSVKKADLCLPLSELLEGCRKVVDFGTGKKYELNIPAGLSPGDTVTVESENLIDGETGKPCTIELTIRVS